jgi:hypothetical protein
VTSVTDALNCSGRGPSAPSLTSSVPGHRRMRPIPVASTNGARARSSSLRVRGGTPMVARGWCEYSNRSVSQPRIEARLDGRGYQAAWSDKH